MEDSLRPAASRRKAAACLAEKLPFLKEGKIGARKKSKNGGQFSARLRADARGGGTTARGQKVSFPLQPPSTFCPLALKPLQNWLDILSLYEIWMSTS